MRENKEKTQIPIKNINTSKKNGKKNKKTVIDTPALSVMYTNADAVTNKLHEIQTLIVIHKPDVIAITEV